jgi:GDP-L-fucose synthase
MQIVIFGASGMVGSAVKRRLFELGYDTYCPTHQEVNLQRDKEAIEYVGDIKPNQMYMCAAKVGGILANNAFPVDFLDQNLTMQNNTFAAAAYHKVDKLLFLGSSCIYPKYSTQPITESALLSGQLEPTNEAYALAKICGVRMCEYYRRQHGCNFVAAMPCNLYGPNDNYTPEQCHLVPALIQRFHEAKVANAPIVQCWGTGQPRRELLHVDDLAEALTLIMGQYDGPGHINVGYGYDMEIREIAAEIANVTGYTGKIHWDHTKPDGTPKKLLDSSRITRLGWQPQISPQQGLKHAYQDYLERLSGDCKEATSA